MSIEFGDEDGLTRYYTPAVVAKSLCVTADTVRQWCASGEIAAVNVGNGSVKPRYVISQDAIDAFTASRKNKKSPARQRKKITAPKREWLD